MRTNTCSEIAKRPAFTLIEVLLGIIILGVGLLGLASVFPLVVKQQREAQDTVVGVTAAKGAEAFITAHMGLNASANESQNGLEPTGGWAKLSWQLYKSAQNNKNTGRVSWDDALKQKWGSTFTLYDNAGVFRIDNSIDSLKSVAIKPVDRLIPAASSGSAPLFVWDMAVSLADPVHDQVIPAPGFYPLRVTVFVRRIDPGIRVPANKTLAQLLIDGKDSQNKQVVPVAVKDGYSTLDGSGDYANFVAPVVTQAYRRFGASGGPFTVIRFGNATDEELGAVRQIGQQLLDFDGNVYTVIALPDESDQAYSDPTILRRSVVISPGLPSEYLLSSDSNASGMRWGNEFELLCTPQIPAAVSSFIVRR